MSFPATFAHDTQDGFILGRPARVPAITGRPQSPALATEPVLALPFTEDDAHHFRKPVLAVLGTASPALFAERHKLLQWPNAEPLDLPSLTHLLRAQDPAAVADRLTGFFARHPIPELP